MAENESGKRRESTIKATAKRRNTRTRLSSTNSFTTDHAELFKYKYVAKIGAELAPGITLVNDVRISKEDPLVVRVHPLGIHWLVGYNQGRIRIYDSNLEKPHDDVGFVSHVGVIEGPVANDPVNAVTDIRFFHVNKNSQGKKINQSTKIVVTYASGHVRVSEYRTRNPSVQRIVAEIQEESTLDLNEKFNSVLCTSISYDNERIVTGGADSKIRVYDRYLEQLTLCHQSDLPEVMDGHAMRVLTVMYHPLARTKPEYQHTFLSAGWDDTVMIWDDRKSQSLWQYHGPHVCSNDALDIDETHNVFLTANWSKDKPMYFIYRFNAMIVSETHFESHDLEKEYNSPIASYLPDPHRQSTCMAYVGRWLNSDTILIAGGNDPLLIIVSKERSEIISTIPIFDNSIISADFRKRSKGGHHLCLCTGDSLVSIVLEKTSAAKKTPKK